MQELWVSFLIILCDSTRKRGHVAEKLKIELLPYRCSLALEVLMIPCLGPDLKPLLSSGHSLVTGVTILTS